MRVTAKLTLAKPGTSSLAFGSIVFENCFVVEGINVISGKNGPFVSFPSKKTQDGKYKDTAFPITKEFRQQIIDAVLAEYDKAAPF